MKKLSTKEFIERVKKIYGDKYDLSSVNYVNYDTKVTIICHIHGEFQIRPDHLLEGHGCPKCGNKRGGDKKKMTKNEFIKKSKEIYGDKYDYSKVEYIDAKTKVCIICPIHGEFWQRPDAHINGKHECPYCSHRSFKYTKEEFIKKVKEIHGDKYDYSKVEYINRNTPICIICPIHGEFWQKPYNHLNGHGCSKCNESKLETEIKLFLEENKILFEEQKRFSWLRNKYPMPLDIYLPQYNVAIECQGEQHFKKREYFKNQSFEERLNMDLLKENLCKEHDLKILYYSKKRYLPKNWNKYEVIFNKKELLKRILKEKSDGGIN